MWIVTEVYGYIHVLYTLMQNKKHNTKKES